MSGKYLLLKTALLGLLLSFIASAALTAIVESLVVSWRKSSFYTDLFSLLGLWTGFLLTCIYALRYQVPQIDQNMIAAPSSHEINGKTSKKATEKVHGRFFLSKLFDNYGFKIKPFVDIPLGVGLGVVAQLYLVGLFSWPLSFFVHNLSRKLSGPADNLVHGLPHTEIIVLGVLVCVMSPLFEELFFRGLLQRAFLEVSAQHGRLFSVISSVILTAVFFAIAHFELLQLMPLFGFGVILGLAAYLTRRLGLGVAAHMAFNAVAYASIARGHF